MKFKLEKDEEIIFESSNAMSIGFLVSFYVIFFAGLIYLAKLYIGIKLEINELMHFLMIAIAFYWFLQSLVLKTALTNKRLLYRAPLKTHRFR